MLHIRSPPLEEKYSRASQLNAELRILPKAETSSDSSASREIGDDSVDARGDN